MFRATLRWREAPRNPAFPYVCFSRSRRLPAMRAPSSARERIPSFRYTRARLASTVFALMKAALATSRFVKPRAAS